MATVVVDNQRSETRSVSSTAASQSSSTGSGVSGGSVARTQVGGQDSSVLVDFMQRIEDSLKAVQQRLERLEQISAKVRELVNNEALVKQMVEKVQREMAEVKQHVRKQAQLGHPVVLKRGEMKQDTHPAQLGLSRGALVQQRIVTRDTTVSSSSGKKRKEDVSATLSPASQPPSSKRAATGQHSTPPAIRRSKQSVSHSEHVVRGESTPSRVRQSGSTGTTGSDEVGNQVMVYSNEVLEAAIRSPQGQRLVNEAVSRVADGRQGQSHTVNSGSVRRSLELGASVNGDEEMQPAYQAVDTDNSYAALAQDMEDGELDAEEAEQFEDNSAVDTDSNYENDGQLDRQ